MPLRCFVASAFGRRDVDTLFDDAISPVLRDTNILPVRVDRIEHNDDIDNRIVDELNRSDLCIADLTYARPSVYYEAGYATGIGKRVIYTCRGDHFEARPNDRNGFRQVHFDLKMKNIIPWTKPDDLFRKRLTRRVRLVARPLFLNINREEARVAVNAKFLSITDADKLERLGAIAEKIARNMGFQLPNGISGLTFGGMMQAVRRDKDEVRIIIVEIYRYLSRRDLDRFHGFYDQPRAAYLLANSGNGIIKRKIAHVFLGSLKPVPIDRVVQAVPYFVADAEIRRFSHTVVLKDGTEQTVDLHIIDDITSVQDFAAKFKSRMRLIETKQSDTRARVARTSS